MCNNITIREHFSQCLRMFEFLRDFNLIMRKLKISQLTNIFKYIPFICFISK